MPVTERRLDPMATGITLFLHAGACVGLVLAFGDPGVAWLTWGLAGVLYILTLLSLTAGYHRLFAHKSYRAVPWLRMAWLLLGAGAFFYSAITWAAMHRRHHRFTDGPGDPHNAKLGFFHAHIGWVFWAKDLSADNVPELLRDPLVVWQKRNFCWLAPLMGLALPTLMAAAWGDALGGLFVAGFLRITAVHHAEYAINSFAHHFGHPVSPTDSARGNFGVSLVALGEGYHAYHHAHPSDYRAGIRWYHFDPTKWCIAGLARLGFASHLRRAVERPDPSEVPHG